MKTVDGDYARPDALGKTKGETIFCADYAEPGMLHGVILRAPVAAGRIVGLDLSKARAMPGVRAVVSAADVPPVLAGWIVRDTPMFASELVRYIGEPIAAVAADTLDQARRARDAILLEIEASRACGTIESALAADAPKIHPDIARYALADHEGINFPRYGNIAAESCSLGDLSDIDGIFANAAHVVEDEFRTQRQYQGYLEPKNAVGIFREGRITVHCGSQWPYNIRIRLGQYFGMPISKVRVIGHTFGGGFGGKLDASVEPHAVALSRVAGGRAVKILNTRSEDIITATSREGLIVKLRSALDADGNILARDTDCYMDNGAYTGETAFLTCFPFYFSAMSYRVGRMRAASRLVYTNAPPTAAMRGVTGVPMYAALESHMDSIAARLGVDRRAYRMRHLFVDGDTLANGQALPDASILHDQFAAVEKIIPWEGERKPYRGRAIAPAIWLVNPLPGSATAKLQEDGSVVILSGASENGSGAVSTGIRQIVAQELGIDPDDVIIPDPDTDIGGFDGGSQGSRTTQVAGMAAMKAAGELKQKIFETAAPLLQASPGELELVDGMVRVAAAPGRQIPLATVGATSTFGLGMLTGSGRHTLGPPTPYDPSCASGLLFGYFACPTYHVHAIEVEVDPVTGGVTVLRYVVAQEVGKVVNHTALRGQIQGAVTQGLGFALYESLRIDEAGETLEKSFEAYRLPIALNTPRVEAFITENPAVDGPGGAKGAAEPPILLPAALVACAVSDAIGRPIRTIPITPEDVLAALMENERDAARA